MNKYRIRPWYGTYDGISSAESYGVELKMEGLRGPYRSVCEGGKVLHFDTREAAARKIKEMKDYDDAR